MVALRWVLSGLALGTSTLVTAQGFDWSECDIPDFATVDTDGAGGGGGFCASKWKQGILINSVRAKADGLSLRGLRIGFTDNSYVEVGAQWSTGGAEGTVTWDPINDRVTNVETWATGWNNGLGRLIMETSNGQRFDAGNGARSDNMGKSINRASGMLIGIRGRHGGTGGAIDNIEFIFAKSNPRSYELRDMALSPSIDEINQRASNGERGLNIESIAVIHFANRTPEPMTASLSGTRQIEHSTSFTQSVSSTFGLSFGYSVGFSVGVEGVASSEASMSTEFSWAQSTESSTTTGTSTTDITSYGTEITVQPNTAARCDAFSLSAEIDVKWTAINTVIFEDNSEWQFYSEGDYQTVEATQAYVSCEPEELTAADDAEYNGERVEDPRAVNLGGPAAKQRRQMGPVKRLSGI